MFLNDDYDEIYVGGDQVLSKVDVNDYHIIQVGVYLFMCLLIYINQCSFCLEGLNKCFNYCVEKEITIVVDSDNFFFFFGES